MFGDGDYVGHPAQDAAWERFVAGGVDLALLIGASGAVPTNDRIAATLQQRGCPVITINPDPAAGGHLRPDIALPLAAGEALTALDRRLCIVPEPTIVLIFRAEKNRPRRGGRTRSISPSCSSCSSWFCPSGRADDYGVRPPEWLIPQESARLDEST